ncbi:MAG: type III pantothenate kinase [Oligoflexia bacterium]|nr:type III pantothenate kinase [Oligoflexia bacterium]
MILALDVGNSQIHGGVYQQDTLLMQFRKNTRPGNSSDEIGLFLRSVLRENDVDPALVRHVAICSVVPDVIHSLRGACQKYFKITPFILAAGARTGLNVKYRNPLEVGTDRIANAIAGAHLYPGSNLIIADFGTATTLDVVTAEKDYLGGLILPGLKISMEALESKTARLPSVEIIRPASIIGKSTTESIQAGLYFQNLYALKGICAQICTETFGGKNTLILGTGGFSRMFENEGVFDAMIPELVLTGLNLALRLNI